MPDLVIRPAVEDDLEVLWDFLAMAAYEPDAEAAKAVLLRVRCATTAAAPSPR
jgi:hypothetical protein